METSLKIIKKSLIEQIAEKEGEISRLKSSLLEAQGREKVLRDYLGFAKQTIEQFMSAVVKIPANSFTEPFRQVLEKQIKSIEAILSLPTEEKK